MTTIDDDDAQADTVNPFDTDVSLRPGNLYANLVLAESEQVFYPDDHDDDHDHHNYTNLVLAGSEQVFNFSISIIMILILLSQLVSAAEAIEKLSAAAAAGQDTLEDFTDPVWPQPHHLLLLHHLLHHLHRHHQHHHCCYKVRDISDSAVRKTVEENQDLRRQVLVPFNILTLV